MGRPDVAAGLQGRIADLDGPGVAALSGESDLSLAVGSPAR
jgi:hypothetical protein